MKQQYLKNIVTLDLNKDCCIGCGRCLEVCPHSVFALDSDKAAIRDRDMCMECGACARNCPTGAITVRAGVGCASAIIRGKSNGSAPCCGESGDGGASCCG
ncbi:MAG: mercury methylation ferredoxin HgcB [Armatimonadota bacterium]